MTNVTNVTNVTDIRSMLNSDLGRDLVLMSDSHGSRQNSQKRYHQHPKRWNWLKLTYWNHSIICFSRIKLMKPFTNTLSCEKVTHFEFTEIPKNVSLLGTTCISPYKQNFEKISKMCHFLARQCKSILNSMYRSISIFNHNRCVCRKIFNKSVFC